MNSIFMNYFKKYKLSIWIAMGNVIDRGYKLTLSVTYSLFSKIVSIKGWGWIDLSVEGD